MEIIQWKILVFSSSTCDEGIRSGRSSLQTCERSVTCTLASVALHICPEVTSPSLAPQVLSQESEASWLESAAWAYLGRWQHSYSSPIFVGPGRTAPGRSPDYCPLGGPASWWVLLICIWAPSPLGTVHKGDIKRKIGVFWQLLLQSCVCVCFVFVLAFLNCTVARGPEMGEF